MEERIHELNSDVEVTCFRQEFNPSTFAIAKADMMIRGGAPNNMRFGDTLSDDQFPGFTFRYCISNPPFGIDWKQEQKAVEAEAAKGELGRFAPGLPKISDGQQLFVLNGLSKLAPGGKMAIIQNGSPLFAGDAGSGPSNIRQHILENAWLDAIVQLSTDQFMNTGISTYIWVLCKDKSAYRCGKVQLIDASHCYEQRRKATGESPDVSLYDHLKKTAAVGTCISEYLLEAEETDYKARLFDHEAVFRGKAAFLMVTADMSGIQRFMYCTLTAGKIGDFSDGSAVRQ